MSTREIHALKKENEALKKRLSELESSAKASNGALSDRSVSGVGGYAHIVSASKSYAGYLLRSLRASTVYKRVWRGMQWVSRVRILSTVMRLLSYAATVIEAGTHIVIVSTLLLVLLPISAFLATITLLFSLVGQRRANAYLSSLVSDRTVYVFLPGQRSALSEDRFLSARIGALSEDDGCTVFVVSPSFWSKAGYKHGKYYLHYRHDRKNVVMLRKYYYFSFMRSVLNKQKSKSTILIY